jgi:hypothetical protein
MCVIICLLFSHPYVLVLIVCTADEMGLWHNEMVHVADLTYGNLQEGVQCKDGRFLLPDPLSARIAPLTQPNTMLFTCKPPTSRTSYLKAKQLNPGWYVLCLLFVWCCIEHVLNCVRIEMISKKLMENDKRPSVQLGRVCSINTLHTSCRFI